jgi:hypothetical protein
MSKVAYVTALTFVFTNWDGFSNKPLVKDLFADINEFE